MNILTVADAFPMPDRNSADFRFSKLLGMIAERHQAYFVALGEKRQIDAIGAAPVSRYRKLLEANGVAVVDGGFGRALDSRPYAAVLFEWHFPAGPLIDEVRVRRPQARVVVDSVDVVFNRLEAKARVTQAPEDLAKAVATKKAELDIYDSSDIVITVTEADAAILHEANPHIATFTVPNIHPLADPIAIPERHGKQLIFIGSFARPGGETNVDAMLYFCGEILPLIVDAEPDVKLRIIGSAPTAEITALASDQVEVLGFVPETRPFLETSAISIAPLRFGGGLKGKIGEAMSCALPVVTTSTGIEGVGLEPGVHALVGDDPRSFADAVIRLLRDRERLEQVRMAGYGFIRERYSDVAVRERVHALLARMESYPLKRTPLLPFWLRKAKHTWERYVGWRLP
jgi:glycosyltransferase involved in cell wall biosynthesis